MKHYVKSGPTIQFNIHFFNRVQCCKVDTIMSYYFVRTRCYTILCVCHTTPTQKLFCLHDFRQAGPPQQIDCLASKIRKPLSVFPKDTATRYRIGSKNQGFATFRLLARRLYQLSYAAANVMTNFLAQECFKKYWATFCNNIKLESWSDMGMIFKIKITRLRNQDYQKIKNFKIRQLLICF